MRVGFTREYLLWTPDGMRSLVCCVAGTAHLASASDRNKPKTFKEANARPETQGVVSFSALVAFWYPAKVPQQGELSFESCLCLFLPHCDTGRGRVYPKSLMCFLHWAPCSGEVASGCCFGTLCIWLEGLMFSYFIESVTTFTGIPIPTWDRIPEQNCQVSCICCLEQTASHTIEGLWLKFNLAHVPFGWVALFYYSKWFYQLLLSGLVHCACSFKWFLLCFIICDVDMVEGVCVYYAAGEIRRGCLCISVCRQFTCGFIVMSITALGCLLSPATLLRHLQCAEFGAGGLACKGEECHSREHRPVTNYLKS